MDTAIKTFASEMTNLHQQIADLRKQATEKSKQVFSDGCKYLFEKIPNLRSFSWTQYTDYFNDGDACNFHAHVYSLDITLWETDDKSGDYKELDPVYGGSGMDEDEKVFVPIFDLLNSLNEDDYEAMFGDHVRVTVLESGIEIEEYASHD